MKTFSTLWVLGMAAVTSVASALTPDQLVQQQNEQQYQQQYQQYQQQVQQMNQQQQEADDDRKAQQNQAKMLGAMGAMMSGLNCAMMRRQAMKEPDESKRNMYLMMAQQSCAQAAQNAASSQGNGDGASKLSLPDAPQRQVAQNTAPTAAPTDAPFNFPTAAAVPTAATFVVPPEQFEATPPPNPVAQPTSSLTTGKPEPEAPGTTPLNPIASDGITTNDNAAQANLPGGGNSGGFGALPPSSAGQADAAKAGGKSGIADNGAYMGRKKKTGAQGDAAGDSGGGPGGAAGGRAGGDDGFNAILAQMMGGGAPPAAGGGAGGGAGGIFGSGGSDSGEPAPNIFQYATFRYRKLGKGQVVVASTKRSIASQKTNKKKATPSAAGRKIASVKP